MKSCGTHVTFVYCDSILCFRIAIIAQKEIVVTTFFVTTIFVTNA